MSPRREERPQSFTQNVQKIVWGVVGVSSIGVAALVAHECGTERPSLFPDLEQPGVVQTGMTVGDRYQALRFIDLDGDPSTAERVYHFEYRYIDDKTPLKTIAIYHRPGYETTAPQELQRELSRTQAHALDVTYTELQRQIGGVMRGLTR